MSANIKKASISLIFVITFVYQNQIIYLIKLKNEHMKNQILSFGKKKSKLVISNKALGCKVSFRV